MSKFKLLNVLTFIVLMIFVFNSFTYSADIKDRMKARLPVIKELKAKGIIGENNKGYLEFVGKGIIKSDVVDAENNDRKEVYAGIAKQLGTTVDVVGKRRANEKAGSAEHDEWIQKESGEWYQKK